jgi:hypothetical protein
MNCQAVQNQVLALPDPRQLPPAVGAHVDACAACRAWARKAARLEALLERLPVPPAPREKKEALIGELMQADPVIMPMAVPAKPPGALVLVGRFLRNNANLVGGLAAAVMVVAGGVWWLNRPREPKVEMVETQKHPLLERMTARNVLMARAKSPAERFEVLGGMAEELAGETRGLARIASPAELKELAGWYDKVVRDGMVRQARELPPAALPAAEKQKLFKDLAARLEADAAETDKLAREAPQDAQPTLKRIADTARDGARQLSAREGK